MKFNISLGKRILLAICVSVFCFVVTGLGVGMISMGHSGSTPWMRIATILQDILMFVLPAILTAFFVTRYPADLLCVRRAPEARLTFLAILTLLIATPAMEVVIVWNQGWTLPASLAVLEQAMRAAEESAQASIAVVLGPHTIPNLVMSVLIVGVLAGFSEEIFFRGMWQRLLVTGRVNRHVAVWSVAVLFSLLHFQIFGFVPRMLLGAFFGYMLLWTRTLWVPVILHVLNNSVYIVTVYLHPAKENANTAISTQMLVYGAISAVVTVGLLYAIWRSRVTDGQPNTSASAQ